MLAIFSCATCGCGAAAELARDDFEVLCEGTGPVHWKSVGLFPEGSAALNTAAVVWTGREVLVWGGFSDPGFRYRPDTGGLARISAQDAPSPRRSPYYAWTGKELIVWGGAMGELPPDERVRHFTDGARYDPELDRWTRMSDEHDLEPVAKAAGVWTGTEFIVWGGNVDAQYFTPRGSRYRPDLDRWTPMSTEAAPIGRSGAAAVWTGSEVIIWGGKVIDGPNPGGAYNPSTDTWRRLSPIGAPEATGGMTFVNDQVIAWGGFLGDRSRGGRYFPSTDSWAPISEVGMPVPRGDAAAVSTGRRLIVFGGHLVSTAEWVGFSDGGIYDPETDSWTPLPSECSEPRHGHTGVWIDRGAFFWGGVQGDPPQKTRPNRSGALLVTPP